MQTRSLRSKLLLESLPYFTALELNWENSDTNKCLPHCYLIAFIVKSHVLQRDSNLVEEKQKTWIIQTVQKSITISFFYSRWVFLLEMLVSHLISHLCLAVIQFLIGVLVNGITVVVNGTHLIKQRKMIPLDLLVSCLAISRICLQLAIFYINLVVLSLMEFPQLAEKFIILTFINESGLWFATWLSLFYCAKIATIAHPHFRLKMRISKLVPWLVLESPLYASGMDVFHSKHR